MKKYLYLLLSVLFFGAAFSLFPTQTSSKNILRVANWAEYIDGGDSDSELVHDFEAWYKEQTGEDLTVEYSVADDNESLYSMIKMGDEFDLVCPSEYMIMKLADENRLIPFPETFFDESLEENYYIRNVLPFINETFRNNTISESNQKKWSDYAAGYMWGTTGFVYNPEFVNPEHVKSWSVFTNPEYKNKITSKNNVRDTYFGGLGMYYEQELLTLKEKYAKGEIDKAFYQSELASMMNDTEQSTMTKVKDILKGITSNLYGFETDEGKNDTIAGKVTINFQWSGDAVYIMDEAEEAGAYLCYSIPESVSNLWFDGWVMPNTCKNQKAAMMFINFLSMPENAVRNMNYIGYTSCIGGEEVFNEICDWYGAEDDDETAVEYDLSYYFGEGCILTTPAEQLNRQLFAQYPDEKTLERCVAMQYFDRDENRRANDMWSDITFS